MRYRAECASNKGSIQSNNTNNYFVDGRYVNGSSSLPVSFVKKIRAGRVVGVFNGLGPDNTTARATFIAAVTVLAQTQRTRSITAAAQLQTIAATIHARICDIPKDTADGLAAVTMALLAVDEDRYYAATLGNCGLYLYRQAKLAAIVPGCTIGESRAVLYDAEIAPNDLFVLCTDGLTNCLDIAIIEGIVRATNGKNVAWALVENAVAAGAQDNTTVVTLQV